MPPIAEEPETEDVDTSGLEPNDIEMIMKQTGASKAKAVNALRQNNGDMVNAIMGLTMVNAIKSKNKEKTSLLAVSVGNGKELFDVLIWEVRVEKVFPFFVVMQQLQEFKSPFCSNFFFACTRFFKVIPESLTIFNSIDTLFSFSPKKCCVEFRDKIRKVVLFPLYHWISFCDTIQICFCTRQWNLRCPLCCPFTKKTCQKKPTVRKEHKQAMQQEGLE
ncbi:nascent polypeptide-associated complex subunit alpha-like protein [Reticulomyxa filosa]|uniref:Nascent polypeptide-associated complex subunit alpha-like protein n=1 Tax=Reticulomyxa filosa TaxID=46433 RepID=X6NKR2_RETFI|nr:nascent polypeptide-associated complex subunit alpha-like protein [Reticulomyxa filosa]|eukprot:ETO26498.1 nascent polypeptide-associated complex subunit alpha-like protein [Reticulomyxa filosa]